MEIVQWGIICPIFYSMTKRCKVCDAVKLADDFYPSDKTCKPCRTAKVRANRLAKIGQYQAYEKTRARDPKRVEARTAYAATDAGQAARLRARLRWQADNPKRKAAHDAVSAAVHAGRLQKHPCLVCGCDQVEAHHPDYDQPLAVVWLCVPHHKEIHHGE